MKLVIVVSFNALRELRHSAGAWIAGWRSIARSPSGQQQHAQHQPGAAVMRCTHPCPGQSRSGRGRNLAHGPARQARPLVQQAVQGVVQVGAQEQVKVLALALGAWQAVVLE